MIVSLLLGCAAPAMDLAPLPAGADRAYANCTAEQLVDLGMDGRAEFRWTEHYDAMGSKMRVDGDRDADGTVDAVMTYRRLPDGTEISHSFDGDNDGVVDSTVVHVFNPEADPKARREVAQVTIGKTGVTDVTRYTYDESGLVTHEDVDREGNGTVDDWTDNEFDAEGRKIALQGKPLPDSGGAPRRTWTYDARGLAVTEATDGDGDGDDDVVQTTAFDGLGRRSTARWDTDGDGHTDNFTFWSYDCPDS